MPKYLLRVDDINPAMSWDNFSRFVEICNHYKIKPLLAVVPQNTNHYMAVSNPIDYQQFWRIIKKLQQQGYEIGLHGYKHHYINKSRGILFLNNYSEFSGVPLASQKDKIRKAINIFTNNKINTRIFVAPGHTFDLNTINALVSHRITYISDGVSLFPYSYRGAIFLPVTLNGPKNALLGVRTICMHLNSFNTKAFNNLEGFVEANHHNIVSFSEIIDNYNTKEVEYRLLNTITCWYKGYYYLRYYLELVYSKTLKRFRDD